MGKIYKIPLGYKILKLHAGFLYNHWFSSVEINGEEKIPEGESVIYAPNHQNAFTDAMALLTASPQPVIFLARADLFKKKIFDKILRWLKIMPAYRMRNGISNLKKNADSFEQAAQCLEHKEFFCLMPEGGQKERRKLRPLVKGMFRIGFTVQDHYHEQGINDNVYIVPTGIDYASYDHSGGHLIVNFGKPINMREYYAKYQENAPVAYNEVRAELYRRMSPLMLDIRTDEHYDTFYASSYIYNYDMLDQMGWDDNETNRMAARQRIVGNLDELAASGRYDNELKELDTLVEQWRKKYSEIEEWANIKEMPKSFDGHLLGLIIYAICWSLPALYSALINSPIFAFVKWACNKWAKGTGFYSSVALGAHMLFFPIYHFLLMVIGGTLIYKHFGGLETACFCVSLPLSYYFAYHYWWNIKTLYKRVKNLFTKDNLTDQIADKISDLFTRLKKDHENGIESAVEVKIESDNEQEN